MKKLIFVMFILATNSSMANTLDSGKKYTFMGSDLSTSCVDGFAERRGLCLGYISGVAIAQKKACIPTGIKFGQLKNSVERYMETNRDKLNQHAFKVVEDALVDAYPCTK